MQLAKDRHTLSILAGSILALLGFGIWLYSQSVVSGLSELAATGTTPEAKARYSGALQWWRLQQTSLLNPMAVIFLAIGIILIVNAFFWVTKRTVTTELEYEI